MKVLICLSALLAVGACGLVRPYVNSGVPSGPVHPAVGPLVATNRGWKDINLEGFSEDDDHDGQVDLIGQAAPVVYTHAAAPAVYAHAPIAAAPAVYAQAPIAAASLVNTFAATPVVKPIVTYAAQPALTYSHQPALTYAHQPAFTYAARPALTYAHQSVVHHAPITTSYTHTVPAGTNVMSYLGTPFVGAVPTVGVASAAAVLPAQAIEGITEA